MVPEDLILRFFEAAAVALEEMSFSNISTTAESPLVSNLSLSECRRLVLEKQKYILLQTVKEYNQSHESSSDITVEQAQDYLAGLNRTNDSTIATVDNLKAAMEESARLAVCRLVLYSEVHWKDDAHRELQTEGTLERSKILDFIALCQTAIRLPCVQKHLADGSPLFEEILLESISPMDSASRAPVETEPTAMKFPQARLERIQRYFSKAVGWDPEFTASELRRLFSLQPNSSEYANDTDIMNRFQQVILRMNAAVSAASLQAPSFQLSDVSQGGVTRVVSVQCSDVPFGNAQRIDEISSSTSHAPVRVAIDPFLTEDEQKHQIRLASEATRLEKEIVAELLSMTEEQRGRQLDLAKMATEQFLGDALALPPGRERILYLQSVDPQTSRLLAMHKLWPNVNELKR